MTKWNISKCEQKETQIHRESPGCTLPAIPQIFRLLSTPDRAMDSDFAFARENHIAVLPILLESGLDDFYSRPDKFGELQYLDPYSQDTTAISYPEKLKRFLESTLISSKMAERVRAAFDAYIFLSYRKKDRQYANELMRLIHANWQLFMVSWENIGKHVHWKKRCMSCDSGFLTRSTRIPFLR